jgi:hypothetical protein
MSIKSYLLSTFQKYQKNILTFFILLKEIAKTPLMLFYSLKVFQWYQEHNKSLCGLGDLNVTNKTYRYSPQIPDPAISPRLNGDEQFWKWKFHAANGKAHDGPWFFFFWGLGGRLFFSSLFNLCPCISLGPKW